MPLLAANNATDYREDARVLLNSHHHCTIFLSNKFKINRRKKTAEDDSETISLFSRL